MSETPTDGWIKFFAPSLCALVVGSTGEEVCNLVPLASVLLHGLDELDILRVCPATYKGGSIRVPSDMDVIGGNVPLRRDGSREWIQRFLQDLLVLPGRL